MRMGGGRTEDKCHLQKVFHWYAGRGRAAVEDHTLRWVGEIIQHRGEERDHPDLVDEWRNL